MKLKIFEVKMGIWKGRSKRKPSGARYIPFRIKRAREIGRDPLYTKVGEESKARAHRGRGGRASYSLTAAAHANVLEGKKIFKTKITSVVENKASRHFVRQNVITKGAIIKTDAGLARVTSKPTKDGVVNAVLLKKS